MALSATMFTTGVPLGAQLSLTVGNGQGGYQSNTYGGGAWNNMTGRINTAFGGAANVTQRNDLSNLSDLLSRDRLWLDQRYLGTLTAAEYGNVAAFLATGRRAVLIGENYLWNGGWNDQIASLVGGTLGGTGCFFQNTSTAVANALTAGVSSVYAPCAHDVAGGTSLFAFPFATLWGASSNVLTIFDSNFMDDSYDVQADNALFATNVATWLATPTVSAVPEPATLALVGIGLGALGVAVRRRA